jgi:hypothetical protein
MVVPIGYDSSSGARSDETARALADHPHGDLAKLPALAVEHDLPVVT